MTIKDFGPLNADWLRPLLQRIEDAGGRAGVDAILPAIDALLHLHLHVDDDESFHAASLMLCG